MTTLTLTLPDEQARRLQQLAAAAGVTPDQLLRERLSEWLKEEDDGFLRAARDVLDKNAELYRRLA